MSSRNENYIELVERAKLGDNDSMNSLVKLARGRLYSFVYRMTLNEDLSQDIVQESMLEMFKVLGKLKQTDRFWPWIYTITYNKVRRHWRDEKRHKAVSLGEMDFGDGRKDNQGGLENLVTEELKELVLSSIKQLKESHRAVLTMRCYENMKYSEIAELMGSSELGTRMLFMRAKKSLQKQLSRRGLSRGALLTALVLFGKMTAINKAAAAQVTVSAAATKVGFTATALGYATSKAAVALTAVSVLAVSTAVIVPNQDQANVSGNGNIASVSSVLFDDPADNNTSDESWYYYPKGPGGSLMMRTMVSDENGKNSYCRVLQDENKNYLFDYSENTIYINNFRGWASDNSVPVLPTDSSDFVAFLSQIQEVNGGHRPVSADGDGLLVISNDDHSIGSSDRTATRYSNVLQDENFKYTWPAGVRFVDNRDAIHRRGWCYFRVEGNISNSQISGTGRIPLFYQVCKLQSPWLKLNVESPDGGYTIVDYDRCGAIVSDDGEMVGSYEPGTFFKGLSRQWGGLHTIDTIRRDAVERKIWFDTKYNQGDVEATVSVLYPDMTAIYSINMEKDLIDKITFVNSSGVSEEILGELKFTYYGKEGIAASEFRKPQIRPSRRLLKESEGINWLRYMANGELIQR